MPPSHQSGLSSTPVSLRLLFLVSVEGAMVSPGASAACQLAVFGAAGGGRGHTLQTLLQLLTWSSLCSRTGVEQRAPGPSGEGGWPEPGSSSRCGVERLLDVREMLLVKLPWLAAAASLNVSTPGWLPNEQRGSQCAASGALPSAVPLPCAVPMLWPQGFPAFRERAPRGSVRVVVSTFIGNKLLLSKTKEYRANKPPLAVEFLQESKM